LQKVLSAVRGLPRMCRTVPAFVVACFSVREQGTILKDHTNDACERTIIHHSEDILLFIPLENMKMGCSCTTEAN
jgi:hypothetical protein